MERINRTVMALIQLLFGYEFLDSGWNKLVAARPSFPAGLAVNLGGMLQGRPGWYAGFIHSVVIPHAALYGYLVEWGEFLGGTAIIAGGIFLLFGKSNIGSWYKIFTALSIAALLVTAFLTLNFWIAAPPLPGLNGADGEGGTIASLGFLVAVILVWWNAAGLRVALSITKGSVIELHRYRRRRSRDVPAGGMVPPARSRREKPAATACSRPRV